MVQGTLEDFIMMNMKKQEQDDCVEVIKWIRKQPWSSGNVGE